jgi:hypothetical protein
MVMHGVGVGRSPDRHLVLDHADQDAADDVDGTIMRPATASPRTNFEAPSMEPKKSLPAPAPRRFLASILVDQARR